MNQDQDQTQDNLCNICYAECTPINPAVGCRGGCSFRACDHCWVRIMSNWNHPVQGNRSTRCPSCNVSTPRLNWVILQMPNGMDRIRTAVRSVHETGTLFFRRDVQTRAEQFGRTQESSPRINYASRIQAVREFRGELEAYNVDKANQTVRSLRKIVQPAFRARLKNILSTDDRFRLKPKLAKEWVRNGTRDIRYIRLHAVLQASAGEMERLQDEILRRNARRYAEDHVPHPLEFIEGAMPLLPTFPRNYVIESMDEWKSECIRTILMPKLDGATKVPLEGIERTFFTQQLSRCPLLQEHIDEFARMVREFWRVDFPDETCCMSPKVAKRPRDGEDDEDGGGPRDSEHIKLTSRKQRLIDWSDTVGMA